MARSCRMITLTGVLVSLSFLLFGLVGVEGENPCDQCDSHAHCYCSTIHGDCYCDCFGYYTGDGLHCKYATWRVVLYVICSALAFIFIFFLCLICLGYFRRRRGVPMETHSMQSTGNPHSFPPPSELQSTANPAIYAYPPHVVNGNIDNNNQQQQQLSWKVPRPTGFV